MLCAKNYRFSGEDVEKESVSAGEDVWGIPAVKPGEEKEINKWRTVVCELKGS